MVNIKKEGNYARILNIDTNIAIFRVQSPPEAPSLMCGFVKVVSVCFCVFLVILWG